METLLLAALIGVGIGLLSGLLGVGGGTIMVPVYRLVFALPPVMATATSLFTIIPTSVSGAVTHIRRRTCLPRLGCALGLGGALTSPLGAWLATMSPGWLVMAAAALVIAYSALTMFQKALKGPTSIPPRPALDAGGKQGTASAESIGISAVQGLNSEADPEPVLAFRPLGYLKAALIGALAGLASGYVGLGGGFLMVPLMVSLLNLPMRLASGTSLIAIMILAIPASITQIVFGNVDFAIGLATAFGSIPGAFLGARLVSRAPERLLRFAFAAFLLVASILLVMGETYWVIS